MAEEMLRIAILDDNVAFTKLEELLIKRRFPTAAVTVFHEPQILDGFDVYLIDNRFGLRDLAIDLCASIRARNPEALIVVWSAYVTKDLLKRLSTVGINAVAEKGNQADVDAALDVIGTFAQRGRSSRSFGATIRSIRDLLVQWNVRLTSEERLLPP
jgi:hypothetical protein